MLRYELEDMNEAPLIMNAYWKTEEENTDLRIDYCINEMCSIKNPLLNIVFSTKVDGVVSNIISDPLAEWCDLFCNKFIFIFIDKQSNPCSLLVEFIVEIDLKSS